MEFTITGKALITGIMPVFDLATKDVKKDYEDYGKVTLVANKKYLGATACGETKFNSFSYPASISNSISTGYTCVKKGCVTVNASELMWFLYWIYVPANFIVGFLIKLAEDD